MSKSGYERKQNGRIAYYRLGGHENAQHWDAHWGASLPDLTPAFYKPYLRGSLGHGTLARALVKYVPIRGRVLEGGCGAGQYVVALCARGYDCIGVDFAPKIVERVKTVLPDAPITIGNITALDTPDESLSAYISLGVMEHFFDGPEKALKEARRVLKKGSLLLVSVPQVFAWRMRRTCAENEKLPDGAVFYQYAFSAAEFRTALVKNGFTIIEEYGYESHFALKVRYEWFRVLLRYIPRIASLDVVLDRLPFFKDIARMRLYIARRD